MLSCITERLERIYNLSITPKIAVFLATYNGEKFLNQQIDSILSQKNVEVDIYCNDDGSSDRTLEIIKSYQISKKNFFIIDSIKESGCAGLNFYSLILTSFGEYDYYAFSDQDDIWLQSKLDTACKRLSTENADGYSANHIAFWNEKELKIYKDHPQTQYDYMFESAGAGCTYVLSKKLFMDLKNFIYKNKDKVYKVFKHDWFIYAFARSRNYKWYLDSEFTLMYRQHNDNETGVNSGNLESFMIRLKNIKSGWFSQQILYLANVLRYQNKIDSLLKATTIIQRLMKLMVFLKMRRKKRDAIILYILYVFKVFHMNNTKGSIQFFNK
tara:strand:+ start:501 stop:1481 length:981 start_codon:yes stop_codon:yes gene_type:complete